MSEPMIPPPSDADMELDISHEYEEWAVTSGPCVNKVLMRGHLMTSLRRAYAAESERDRLAERLKRAEEILRGVANHGTPKFNRQIAAFLAESNPTEKQA